MIEKIKIYVKKTIHFLRYGIWRIGGDDDEYSANRIGLYNVIKAFILAIKTVDGGQINTRAAALTYNTLLSIVPMLAVLFGLARGFGFQNIIESQLFSFFSGQEELLSKAMAFMDKSLEYAQSNVFIGVGVILLLYTVINLFWNIEDNFNALWMVKKSRSYYRMFTDYLTLFIIIPIFLTFNSALSVVLNVAADSHAIGVVLNPIIKVVPYIVIIFLFTFIYAYIPNTKVKFKAALFGGIFAGISFQIFQMLYISGQIWISRYNAIYGSFAALPLLLLWIQLSWFICLFGVELSFAFQNVKKFSFEHETNNISRRYKDFVTLLIATLIVKRFEIARPPYTADELSEKYKIPTQLTNDTLYLLTDVGILTETLSMEHRVRAYIPAMDINKISVEYLFEKIDLHGSENFIIDTDIEFRKEWDTILDMRNLAYGSKNKMLLKDL